MAPVWIHLTPRDGNSVPSDPASSTARLDTGAIAGIACAAGALFLGGIGLFVVYWHRQKQFDREEMISHQPVEENPFTGQTPPVYTLDYKMNRDSSITGGSVSSYMHSPDPVRPDSFSPLGGMVSAMPTHPAYIPRAFVRGSTPAPLEPTPEEETLTSAPSPPRPVYQSKSQPDDLIIQAYLRTTDGERVPSEIIRFASSSAADDDQDQHSTHSRSSSTRPLRPSQSHHSRSPPPSRGTTLIPLPDLSIFPSRPALSPLDIPATKRKKNSAPPVELPIQMQPQLPTIQPPPPQPSFRQKYHQHLRPTPQQAPLPLQQRAAYDEKQAHMQSYPYPPIHSTSRSGSGSREREPREREKHAPPVLAFTPTIGRAVTTTVVASGNGSGNEGAIRKGSVKGIISGKVTESRSGSANGSHKRDDSTDRRIGDWIAAQPNFRDVSGRGERVNPNRQVEVREEDVW